MNILKPYISLPRTIYILFLARTINCIGSFVYPFLTMLLTLKLGFNETMSGLLTTLTVVTGGVGLLLGGKMADIFGRKKLIIIFSLISAGCFFICAFLGTSVTIAYLIIVSNFFSFGQVPALNAMVIDITNTENRKNAFSLIYLATNVGIAIGPLIAGFLFDNYLTWIFLIDALTTVAALVPIGIMVKETLPSGIAIQEISETSTEKPEAGNMVRVLFRRPILLIFSIGLMIYSLVYAQYGFGLPIYVSSIFAEGPRLYGIIMAINAALVVAATLFLVEFMKRIKPIINIGISGILFAVGFGMLYYSKLFIFFIISTVIWTLGEIINTVNSNVFIANHSPITHRGRFNAVVTFISQSGFAASPIIFGRIIYNTGVKNIWPIIFYLSLLAALFMFLLYFFDKAKEK